jgi:hypothetical protein
MREATLIMAYYENKDMLSAHYAMMRKFSKEVRKNMRVIVVDDGSPFNPATPGDCGCPLEIYRINVDIRWNQDAARNIGAHYAQTEWLIVTDIDHMVPEATWQYVQTFDPVPNTTYKFNRVSAPAMDPYKPHPNSYFINKHDLGSHRGDTMSGLPDTTGLMEISATVSISIRPSIK